MTAGNEKKLTPMDAIDYFDDDGLFFQALRKRLFDQLTTALRRLPITFSFRFSVVIAVVVLIWG